MQFSPSRKSLWAGGPVVQAVNRPALLGSPSASRALVTGDAKLEQASSTPSLPVWREHLVLASPSRRPLARTPRHSPSRRAVTADGPRPRSISSPSSFPSLDAGARDVASEPAAPAQAARGMSDEDVQRHLGSLKWFAGLSPSQLETLHGRASLQSFPRYSTIIREGNVGSVWYLLLSGLVRIASDQFGISFLLGDGCERPRRDFGEAALVGGSIIREVPSACACACACACGCGCADAASHTIWRQRAGVLSRCLPMPCAHR